MSVRNLLLLSEVKKSHSKPVSVHNSLSSELGLAADKVLIVGDFNIQVDNEKNALGSAFIDILNSIGLNNTSHSHCRNHTLDLILSHGIDVNGVDILKQSDDISDNYQVL